MKIVIIAALAGLAVPAPALAENFDTLGALLAAARAAGENSADIADIALVQGTSRHLLAIEGDIDFPFSVGIDLPLNAQPRSLNSALSAPDEKDDKVGRFAVVFQVALAKVTRRVRDMKEKTSYKIVSINKVDNPAYLRAVKLYDGALAKLEKRSDNPKLVNQLNEAQTKLTTTPRFLEQAVYGSYPYKLADIEDRKALTVNYFVIDRVAKSYMKSTFDVVENERFTLAYDLDPTDPGQHTLSSDVAKETQVRDWERAPVIIPLSQLLDHAVAAGGPVQHLASTDAFLSQLAQQRSNANARAVAETYDERPLNDPRFGSVVAIYTAKGMGSGFYVRSNIVMTNWHVVERQPIVELRLYDKRETFGQVIAKDVLLDLALVKVQDRGRPVEFMQGKDVLPGEQLDAIGHPKRQLFTITRGVVSAIRKQRQRADKTHPGKDVLYIQTDAEINPGNSGGPLFKGDKVVGINTWTALTPSPTNDQVWVAAPGLHFAIHYSEAKRFLDEAMRGE